MPNLCVDANGYFIPFSMIFACYPQPEMYDNSCTIIVMSQNVIGFEAYQFLHCEHVANSGLKYDGRYCVAGRLN